MPKKSARKLTDLDRLVIAILTTHHEFRSSGALTGDGNAMLKSCERYLSYVGLGDMVPYLEKREYDRVAGVTLAKPGRKDMPEECLACYAAVGMDSKRKKA